MISLTPVIIDLLIDTQWMPVDTGKYRNASTRAPCTACAHTPILGPLAADAPSEFELACTMALCIIKCGRGNMNILDTAQQTPLHKAVGVSAGARPCKSAAVQEYHASQAVPLSPLPPPATATPCSSRASMIHQRASMINQRVSMHNQRASMINQPFRPHAHAVPVHARPSPALSAASSLTPRSAGQLHAARRCTRVGQGEP